MDIDRIIKEINEKSQYRTRYAGQEPRWDETLVNEIERLRKENAGLVQVYDIQEGLFGQCIERFMRIGKMLGVPELPYDEDVIVAAVDRLRQELAAEREARVVLLEEIRDIVIQNSRPASSVLLAPHPRCCREAAGPFQSVEGRD